MDRASPRPRIPADALADLERRLDGFETPSRSIEPSRLQRDELQRLGLPPRPYDTTHEDLRRVWERGFGKELDLKPFVFDQPLRTAIEVTPYRSSVRYLNRASIVTSPIDTSRNWAGAYLTANRNRRFSQIWGVWKTPETLIKPSPPRAGRPNLPFACSSWIGLDGQYRYLNSSLPQVGTVSLLQDDGSIATEAWVQWWARDAKYNAPVPLPLPLSAGDEVLCVLTAIDARSVVAVVVNLSETPPVAMAVRMTSNPVEIGGVVVEPEISGVTAEWIVERPRIVDSPDSYNLPDYDHVRFDMCVAVESAHVDLEDLPSGQPLVLHGTRFIRMQEIRMEPVRSIILSLSKKLSPTSLSVTYGGFQ